MTAQACSVRLRRLLDFRSPPVSPWPMQSKADRADAVRPEVFSELPKALSTRLAGAVQHQEARRPLPRHDVADEDVSVERNAEAAHHPAPHRASRSPEERVRRRETAAAKTSALPQISTRERARVRPV